jgi:hypothetical protein
MTRHAFPFRYRKSSREGLMNCCSVRLKRFVLYLPRLTLMPVYDTACDGLETRSTIRLGCDFLSLSIFQ